MISFCCNTEELRQIVKDAVRIIPTRTVEDRFYSFRFEVDGSTATIWATRPGEVIYRNVLNNVVILDGEPSGFLVHATRLANLLAPLTAKVITISMHGDKMTVQAKPGRWTYEQKQCEYHPAANWPSEAASFSTDVPAAWLRTALKAAAMCADERSQLAIIRGVNFCVSTSDGGLRVFGTDGSRMSMAEHDWMSDSLTYSAKAIHVGAANLLAESLDTDNSALATFRVYSSGVAVVQGDRRIFCNGVPTYNGDPMVLFERGMPNQDFTFGTEAWRSMLRRALLMSDDRSVTINLDSESLELQAECAGRSCVDRMPSHFSGSPRSLLFNGRLLLEFMETVEDEFVTWRGTPDDGPQIFESYVDGLRFVLMPLVKTAV